MHSAARVCGARACPRDGLETGGSRTVARVPCCSVGKCVCMLLTYLGSTTSMERNTNSRTLLSARVGCAPRGARRHRTASYLHQCTWCAADLPKHRRGLARKAVPADAVPVSAVHHASRGADDTTGEASAPGTSKRFRSGGAPCEADRPPG